jgi:hypothetical protein
MIGMSRAVGLRTVSIGAIVLAISFANSAVARNFEMGGDDQFPYSIMAPEPGGTMHHRSTTRQPLHHRFYNVRGSSGSVLPTPLPRTPLIPPEGNAKPIFPAVPQEQPPTILQGSTKPIPNLPHGPETFQDRASRCAFQSGLSNVPGNLSNQYMGSCVQ